MQKNITIKISAETAHWARVKAAKENTSVSKLVGEMLEKGMKREDSYWAAYERFKTIVPTARVSAKKRMTREKVHERR
ncbi:MAG: hypothetical protein HY820_19990 [Acidobacteria bacterium]|nr:hypothetical protein [Acidobacteriota bacterium]